MAKEFKLPELGENITSADVLTVLIRPGDNIEKDQTLIEIETDKATIEVPSNMDGVIKEVLVKPGTKINVGDVLFTFETLLSKETNSKISATVPQIEVPNITSGNKNSGTSVSPAAPIHSKDSFKETFQTSTLPELQIIDFKLPELGENIESADVLNV